MVAERPCSFCKKNILPGTGYMVAQDNGNVLFFCSRKCRENLLKLRRNPIKYKWSG
jgi:large subunit ribosomal protein L24e